VINRLRALLVTSLLAITSAASAAPTGVRVDYLELKNDLAELGSLPNARYVRYVGRVQFRGNESKRAELMLRTVAEDIAIEVSADGTFELPQSAALERENPQIWTNLSEAENPRFEAVLEARATPQRDFTFDMVQGMREEIEQLGGRRNLLGQLQKPKVEALSIEFGANVQAEVRVVSGSNSERFLPDSTGVVQLPLRSAWLSGATNVSISTLPRIVRLKLED
jgi:hypothetical protein